MHRVALDRGADHNQPVLGEAPADEKQFAEKVAALNADVVIDMIGFTPESTKLLIEALKGTRCTHFLHVGSIWSHGHSEQVPTEEGLPKDRFPLEKYGQGKNDIEQYLLHSAESRQIPFACTILHAGHIVGRCACVVLTDFGS